ncbi:GntR family transcriptional regulator [Paracoccus sp. M683]|uniref:GntR family transcriptional regulator n=1 Tax=Paracoccus sp. M683 TaxID=2594268 RepID=UPI00117F8A80|nr:GntR family transcriptional regulator [Paracoccus sp. M683]TRW95788.1 GntR family transcriptional regulator [Paracoccus sp. M683]
MTNAPAHSRPGETGERPDVLSRMRFDILSLELAPGQPLSERALESDYGVSRTPIREALLCLAGDGLVLRSGRSYIVAPFDMDEIAEIFAFRDIVEPAAIRLATRNATAEALDAIRRDATESHDIFTPERWLAMAMDFHVRLANLSGNRCLTAALRDITIRTIRARWLVVASDEGRAVTHREHHEILDLVGAGDAEAAVQAARRHAAAVHREVVEAIRASRGILGRRSVVGL